MKLLQVILTEEEHKKLKIQAASEGTTISDIVREVLFGSMSVKDVPSVSKPVDNPVKDAKAMLEKIGNTAPDVKLCKHGSLPRLCKFALPGKDCR